MALPFLPYKKIAPMLGTLEGQASTPKLQEFTEYVKSTWVESETWPPSSWSVYMQAVRTNNDVEGWHHGLHRRASVLQPPSQRGPFNFPSDPTSI